MKTRFAEAEVGTEFREFFVDQMKDIYWAEQHLHKALRKFEKTVRSKKLASAFRKHMKDIEWHVRTLERIFEMLDERPKARRCKAMAGLIKEDEWVVLDTEKNSYTRDAGLILALQRAAHYGIASYGTMRIFASNMERGDISDELEKIFENEKETDINLTNLAEDYINERAAEE